MQPTDIIFQSVSNLTGGLITDMTTLIVGLVTLAFILMGLDVLVSVLVNDVHIGQDRRASIDEQNASYDARNRYWAAANNAGVNFEEDEKQAKYEQARSDYKKHL